MWAVRLAFLVVWMAAAAFLATTSAGEEDAFRIVAAFVVGLPAAYELSQTVRRRLGDPGRDTRYRVKRSLQRALVKIYDENFYTGKVTKISFHVWLIPGWYRKTIPYRLRHRGKQLANRLPIWTRPHLVRFAVFRFEHHSSAEVRFRKGVGIIGRCIDLNRKDHVMTIALDSKAFRVALADQQAWAGARDELTHGLPFAAAQQLADAYGQVATVVLRETWGEAIGCLTMELPRRCKLRLTAQPKTGSPEGRLMDIFHEAKDAVENHLTRSSS